MRRPTFGLFISLFALVGALLPFIPVGPTSLIATVAAATSPKVAIIVGPAGANTAGYKSDADTIAATARLYTPNVVQVYTPNATWAAAKAALEGASIVVYMGHGNGFPSPYSTTLQPLTQDGLGLNPVAGVNDSTTQYFGEAVLASQIRLAPGALVLLDHLCYASGNSEPGRPDPSLSVAQQRVDNFAAGFLAAGARAVIANAYYGSSQYIDALFTTDLTIDQIWQSGPGANPNIITFPSTRTPGMTAEMNPDATTGKYWRSLVGQLDLRASQITGATGGVGGIVGSTPAAPGAITVPGTATVAVPNAPLFASPALTTDPTTGQPLAYLPEGTTVHLIAAAGIAQDGSPAYAVTIADGPLAGYMPGSVLAPAATPVRLLSLNDGGGTFSPNGDGRSDAFQLSAQLSAPAAWQVAFGPGAGAQSVIASGTGSTVNATWDGTLGGTRVPDGRYAYTIRATDASGAMVFSRSGSVVVDTVPPTLAIAAVSSASATVFSPNGDGVADTVKFGYTLSEPGWIDLTVHDAAGTAVRTTSVAARSGTGTVGWDGRSDAGTVVPEGTYTVSASARDAAGNVGAAWSKTVAVYSALSAVRTSVPAFFPQAPDGAPATTSLTFALAAQATVTWTITDAGGRRILTQIAAQPLGPGSYAFAWDGRDQSGTIVPRGTYYSVVRATNGPLAFATRVAVVADAFAVRVSDSTPSRGQTITVTALSARPLVSAPKLTIVQAGAAPRTVAMPATSAGYRVRVRLAAGTPAGILQLIVTGRDGTGLTTSSSASYPLG